MTHIIESCRDVTERKRAEDALAQDRNLLRTLIDNLPDCIYVKDTQGRFIAANLATARLMGAADPERSARQDRCRLLSAGTGGRVSRRRGTAVSIGAAGRQQERIPSGRGRRSETVMTTKIPLLDSQGKVYGLVGISRDLTGAQNRGERPSRKLLSLDGPIVR